MLPSSGYIWDYSIIVTPSINRWVSITTSRICISESPSHGELARIQIPSRIKKKKESTMNFGITRKVLFPYIIVLRGQLAFETVLKHQPLRCLSSFPESKTGNLLNTVNSDCQVPKRAFAKFSRGKNSGKDGVEEDNENEDVSQVSESTNHRLKLCFFDIPYHLISIKGNWSQSTSRCGWKWCEDH